MSCYDSNHKNANRVYQQGTTFVKEGKEDRTANTPPPMAKIMQMVFPELKNKIIKTFQRINTFTIPGKDGKVNSFNEANGYLPIQLFQVLTYRFIEGNLETALMSPNSLFFRKRSQKCLGKNLHWINSSCKQQHQW
jgi:putative ABC transport system permease protein